MTRTTVRLGAAFLLLILMAGCLINSGGEETGYYTYLKIRPDMNLQTAPEGYIYQFFLIDIDLDTLTGQPTSDQFEFVPLVRFQWDPESFRTLDESGKDIPLYDPSGPGMDMGVNILGHVVIWLGLEPIDDPNPELPNGSLVMFYLDPAAVGFGDSFLETNLEATLRLDDPLGGIRQFMGGQASFTLAAQSHQYGRENVCWHDETEGWGLWFAQTLVQDLRVMDTAGFGVDPAATSGKGTLFNKEIDQDQDSRKYNIWIFPDHPESSWSNFDNVFPNTVPDMTFRDGHVTHDPQSSDVSPPSSGPNALGSTPWERGGKVIGYLYFPRPEEAPDFTDTCFLRVDYPESTYCTQEPEFVRDAPIDDTNLVIRVFTFSWADTLVTPSLLGLPILNSSQTSLEYEAWLIFDSSQNPVYPPLSLGRFSGDLAAPIPGGELNLLPLGAYQRDQSNPYTDTDNFDPNFSYPGEDFLHDLPNGLPSPLDVMSFDGAERLKVWITIEPVLAIDHSPSEPNRQMIAFVGEIFRPDGGLEDAIAGCGQRGRGEYPASPATLSYPLFYRPISTDRSDLSEGFNWPTMMIFVSNGSE